MIMLHQSPTRPRQVQLGIHEEWQEYSVSTRQHSQPLPGDQRIARALKLTLSKPHTENITPS